MKQWLDPNSISPWKTIEQDIIAPIRLRDFLFSGLSINHCTLRYGPVLTYMLQIIRQVERLVGFTSKWHKTSPVWHNNKLLSGNKPFIHDVWAEKGIWVIGDLNGEDSLLSFNDLVSLYGIPRHSLFFYFRLRSAFKAHKVVWGSEMKEHPIVGWIKVAPKSVVSFLYARFLSYLSPKPSTLAWDRAMALRRREIDWNTSWDNICSSSHNPNHQFIHMKIYHRVYLTPRIRHLIGHAPHPFCTLCSQNTLGTFMHIMWDCPKIYDFWNKVLQALSDLIDIQLPMDPALHLLNDDSKLEGMNERSRKIWLAGLTAAKKIIVQVWVPPHNLAHKHWLNTFLEILFLELSSAKINGATPRTIQTWSNGIARVQDILLERH